MLTFAKTCMMSDYRMKILSLSNPMMCNYEEWKMSDRMYRYYKRCLNKNLLSKPEPNETIIEWWFKYHPCQLLGYCICTVYDVQYM
jgi:hypothetical protein